MLVEQRRCIAFSVSRGIVGYVQQDIGAVRGAAQTCAVFRAIDAELLARGRRW
ncbi:hypothetical protein ACU686_05845 [Yinghuangia aomiensis]